MHQNEQMKDNFNNREEEKLRLFLKDAENKFSVPDGYFESLPGKITEKINSLPDLETSKGKNLFSVPSGYFEDLPSEINSRITGRQPRLIGWLNSLQRPRIAIPLALATMIFLGGLYFYTQRKIIYFPQNEFTAEELQNSVELQNIDEDLIVNLLENSSSNDTINNFEQYLIENNIDLTQIENEL